VPLVVVFSLMLMVNDGCCDSRVSFVSCSECLTFLDITSFLLLIAQMMNEMFRHNRSDGVSDDCVR
jgi:hypothetical protein